MAGLLAFLVILSIGFFGFFGWIGVLSFLVLILLFGFYLLLFSERGIERSLRAGGAGQEKPLPGLSETVGEICKDTGLKARRVVLFPDPYPRVICARSWGSEGTLFLSEGSVELLGEEDLRTLISLGLKAFDESAENSLVLQSAKTRLATLIWRPVAARWDSGGSLGLLRVSRDSFLYAVFQSLVQTDGVASALPDTLSKLDQIERVWAARDIHLDPYSPLSIP